MNLNPISDIKHLDDGALIVQYKQTENAEIIGVLFKRYTHLVYGTCMKYLKDEDNSKDTVMQIFEKLLLDLKKHEIQNFKGWLHTVAKNYCFDKSQFQNNWLENKHYQNCFLEISNLLKLDLFF